MRDFEVREILEGRKTQKRWIVKPQPDKIHDGELYWYRGGYRAWTFRNCTDVLRCGGLKLTCPYGQPGDRLWVREKWMDSIAPKEFTGADQVKRGPASNKLDGWIRTAWHFGAPDPGGWPIRYGWKSPVKMPRWASRIALEIVSVRVERLNDISNDDAKSEGVEPYAPDDGRYVAGFKELWESINSPCSWDLNPWVWVVEFEEVKP